MKVLQSTTNPAARPAVLVAFAVIIFLAGSANCLAQTAASPSPTPKASVPDRFEGFRRYVQLDTLAASTRFRYVRTASGSVNVGQVQYQIQARGRFKFDRKGRYSVGFGVETANAFNGGWNSTGIGAGPGIHDLHVRELYFAAKPVDGIEFQIGGLGIERGEGTEITTYDNDGYIVGERLNVTMPKRLYFDGISATRAFLGDLTKANVFRRLHRLDEANYYQFMVRKTVNKALSFSADYTYDSGTDTLRQGVRLTLPKKSVLDAILLESYQRIDPDPGFGFAVTGRRKVNDHLTLSGGFAQIDRLTLNADRFPKGKRIFASVLVPLTRDLSLNAVGIQGVGHIDPNIPLTRLEMIFTWNALETLRRFKIQ